MCYSVVVMRRAEKALEGIHPEGQRRVYEAIVALGDDPRPPGIKAMHGSAGGYRLRVGPYRVLYTVDDKARAVTVYLIAHRREVYRGL